jgi:hypothetical protein
MREREREREKRPNDDDDDDRQREGEGGRRAKRDVDMTTRVKEAKGGDGELSTCRHF